MAGRKTVLVGLIIFLMALVNSFGQVEFRQLYLSGKVTLPDGAPPPGLAQLELVCRGQVQPQEYTKEDGSFSFAVGGSSAGSISARGSSSSSVGSFGEDQSYVNMSDCQVRAALAGYQSSVIQLGRRSVFESPDIGTLVLTPLGEGGVPARDPLVSVSEAKAPKKASDAYEKAKQELFKEKPDPGKAEKELEKAVAEFPEYAAAWYLMGEARLLKQDTDGAREALQKAMETDPGFATPYVALSLLELRQENLEAAAKASDQAIELVPNHVEACYYNGMAYANLGDFDKAKASLGVVANSSHGEKFPQAFYLLGTIHGQQGNVEGCVSNYRRYLELDPDSQRAQAVKQQLDQWKSEGVIQ